MTAHPLTPGKQIWPPGTLLAPVPVVMVSCGGHGEVPPNIITIAWAGTICSEPPMLSIAVRPERHSFELIQKNRAFVVNLPTTKQAWVTDWCGVKSGRDVNKFKECKLTAAPASKVRAPIIAECPVNLECELRSQVKLGSHVLFLAEIVAVQVDSLLVDKTGKLQLERAGLLAFAHGGYFALGRHLGHFGFSVRKAPAPAPTPRAPSSRR